MTSGEDQRDRSNPLEVRQSMTTQQRIRLFTSRACLEHLTTPGHPERPERLAAVLRHLRETGLLTDLDVQEAPPAHADDLALVHGAAYLDALERLSPRSGFVRLDADTPMSPGSLQAAKLAAGAAVSGVDDVLEGAAQRVFCAVRPPGHHAEESAAMGFCLLNGIAVAAAHALARGVARVAVLDFDVHHGNGTVEAFMDEPRALVCSSFQFPHYPYRRHDVKRPNIVNTPLPAATTGSEFRRAVERDWLPALDAFKPHLVLVSAGFDAHAADPLGDLLLGEEDFVWVTNFIVAAAAQHAEGRVVSVLEGGYDLEALAHSVAAHLQALG